MPPRPLFATLVLGAALAAGCGDDEPLPSACTRGPDAVLAALDRAPGRVALADGTPLSRCVARARSDADIQTVGAIYTQAADALARDFTTSDRAALRVGYLIGAVRRGASHTSGIHSELVRRLEQSPDLDGAGARRRRAFRRGLATGGREG
jgi:hypothetical protein